MQIVEIIRKKRDGGTLSGAEISWFIQHYTQGDLPDYQAAALLMAIFWRGMNALETSQLTLAMAASGAQLKIRQLVSPVVDKHSTGGVGDKVTLAVAPLVTACGVAVGKMSGRGLGHTGGTIDKLESITGFNAELSRDDFLRILSEHQLVLAGQSNELAPADGKLYALRDVTGTIESIPLIASSIMSKKLAIGASHLLLDVKFGSGAFMKTVESARELASTMVEIGRNSGMHTVASITSMDQPLGRAIGNALEMKEAIAILKGEGPDDVSELCYHEAAELLMMTGKASSMKQAEQQVARAVHNGAAIKAFAEVVAAQGGDRRQVEEPDLLPAAPSTVMLTAPHSGYLATIHAERIGLVSMQLGAGRFKKGEEIDHRTGLVLQAKIGAYLQAGAPLVEIHARNEQEAHAVQAELLSCYTWSEAPVPEPQLIWDTIRP
ncbi:thymidine phosphorylase [Tengunoibacter tsumagoiensis]|uniref:Thymidine phosphorylase n=1 Tax=Tengunoibacter tsumagoiensis TaxID=2014871 RepID=A0A401ZTM1_9CHLR|nr:thymidine phosphorylase [Tengunoibacter tsumagoiensis]